MRKTQANILRLIVVAAVLCSLVVIVASPASAAAPSWANVTLSPATADTAATWTIQVNTLTQLTAGGTITITFPDEVTMPSAVPNTMLGGNISWGTTNTCSVSGQQLICVLPSGQTMAAGNNTITISQGADIKTPKLAKTEASQAYPLKIHTSADTTDVTTYVGIIPSYTVTPTSASRGDTVTVTGKGWTPNSSITIGPAATVMTGTGTSDASGAFSVTASPVGTGIVTVTDGAGQSITAATTAGGTVTWDYAATVTTFTMKARITVTPTSGRVGSTYYIYGYDFTSGGNVLAGNITIGGAAATVVSGSGAFTTKDAYSTLDDCLITCTVPCTQTGGAKEIKVIGNATKSATATFTVATPTITVSPSSGPPNTLVTVTGSNFGAGATFDAVTGLTFKGTVWNTSTITADANGNWEYSIRVPVGAVSGANPIVATSTGVCIGTTASTVFTVSSRSITVSPASGPSGTQVTVSASSLTASGTVAQSAITFAGAAWNTASGTLTIDSLGNLSPTTLRVPTSSATGANTVALTDSGTLTAAGTFTVTQPTISISPSQGFKGDTLTVTGSGWVPGTTGLVTLTFNSVTQVTAIPDTAGNITAQFAVPLTAVSGQLVGASDSYGNAAASKTFLIDNAAITLDPASGPAGTTVTVTGAGFQPQSAVTALTIGGGSVLPTSPVVTNALGGFTTTLTVPGLATGAQTVLATVYGTSASTFFTITAAPATVATSLSGISDELVRVWGYTPADGWKMYDPADTVGSDLTGLTAGKGYWINVDEDCSLIYGGNTYSFEAGWNLIGWQG